MFFMLWVRTTVAMEKLRAVTSKDRIDVPGDFKVE